MTGLVRRALRSSAPARRRSPDRNQRFSSEILKSQHRLFAGACVESVMELSARRIAASCGVVTTLVLPFAAMAQETLPPIVINAPSPIAVQTLGVLAGTLIVVPGSFAPVTVVTEEEIRRSTAKTLGDLLASKPGITASNFAPGASRPIIRGLDNYRVRIQENGVGSHDVSEIGEDHGVPIDPLAARQVEVIRGPATLRWGSQAIGGVVDVTNNRIPTAIPPRGFGLELNGGLTSVDNGFEGSVLLDAGKGNFAFHADAFARNASDYRIPSYPYRFPPDPAPVVGNRQPNSAVRSDGQSVGGSVVFDGGFVGAAVTHFSSLYRVPGIEATETNTRIDMNQTKVTSKGEFRPQSSAIEAIRFWLGATDYKHNELANEGGFDGVQQTFTNKEQEGRVEVQLAPFDLRWATLTSAFGVQAGHQKLAAPGAEGGLFDPNRTSSVAGYLFNEFRFTDLFRAQLAGRIESVRVKGTSPDFLVDPDTALQRDRSFTPKSVALGFLHDLPWNMVASVTGQYVERAPRAPELLSRGVHEATETFDIGNPDLGIEAASTVEAGVKRAQGPLRFEATAYYTQYKGFIYRRLTGETCDEDFASCTPAGTGTELNQAIYSQRDARFRGAEVAAQLDVMPLSGGTLGIDGQYDVVRATFSDGSNVPRIPPQRLGGGVFWRNEMWFARVGLLHAFAQNDPGDNETTTPGYNLLRAEITHTRRLESNPFGARELVLGVVGDNLLNEDMRNSASFKKDEVLLPGRGVKGFATVRF
jgi:iron complex outermembrane receptor protein